MPAYAVNDYDASEPTGCVVFAKSNIEARRKGASELDCDEIGGLTCVRAKWADEFEATGKIPAATMLANGWQLTCVGCDQILYEGGTVTRYDEDDNETEVDIDPVGTQHSPYCTPECRQRDHDQRARRKRGERRFWEALKREALRKFPGITIDPEKTDGRWSGHHHRFFGWHRKSGRDRAICFEVKFTFPGAKYGGGYRYDLAYEATRGVRTLLIANADKDTWDAWIAAQREIKPPATDGENLKLALSQGADAACLGEHGGGGVDARTEPA